MFPISGVVFLPPFSGGQPEALALVELVELGLALRKAALRSPVILCSRRHQSRCPSVGGGIGVRRLAPQAKVTTDGF